MKWTYDDGGRMAAGFKGLTGDCVTRAIAIATQLPYQKVYDLVNLLAQKERPSKRRRGSGKSHARTGVYKGVKKALMESLGWKFKATMTIGSGCKVHLNEKELPKGRIICKVSRHSVAVIDGVIHDTYDCSRNGRRCVYGYWYKP